MTNGLSRAQAVLVGLVVLLALALAALGIFAIGSRGWFGKDALHVRAAFAEVRGVEVGTRVRIQGIDAGEVAAILPPDGPDRPVILRLRLKGEFRHLVRAGSTVQIVPEGMLGGKVLEVRPPAATAGKPADLRPVEEDELLASAPSAELTDVLAQVNDALKGDGTIGKLMKDPEVAELLAETLRSISGAARQGETTMAAGERGMGNLRKLPLVGKHFETPTSILVRAGSERNRRVFAETELFEAGRAALTTPGKGRLDELGPWLRGLRHKGADVVVVSYADAKKADARTAQAVTQQQAEAVLGYLKDEHKVHKIDYVPTAVRQRPTTALGMGSQAPPAPEREALPAARVEVIVFVPQ